MCNEIVEILMRRDGMSRADAENCVEKFQQVMMEEIEEGATLLDIEDLIADELGLEPDYLDYFIM